MSLFLALLMICNVVFIRTGSCVFCLFCEIFIVSCMSLSNLHGIVLSFLMQQLIVLSTSPFEGSFFEVKFSFLFTVIKLTVLL